MENKYKHSMNINHGNINSKHITLYNIITYGLDMFMQKHCIKYYCITHRMLIYHIMSSCESISSLNRKKENVLNNSSPI